MKTGKRGRVFFFLLPIAALFLGSCGLEEYLYIEHVEQSNVNAEGASYSVVRISDNSATSFTHYVIFYRIYLSDTLTEDPMANLYLIHPSLSSDHATINSYIINDNLVTTNMDSFFTAKGRDFKYLSLQGAGINSVLALPNIRYLVFDFSSLKVPTMEILNSDRTPLSGPFTLWRADGFTPIPADRSFVSTDDLRNGANINEDTNTDVKSNSTDPAKLYPYAYAALYIVAVGFDTIEYKYIYSRPCLIHVFRLPESS